MSGHSKWKTIKRKKGVADAARGQVFTKLARDIAVAARAGGADVEMNFRLRLAVQKAKENNMPVGNVERAIQRGAGTGEGGQVTLEEVVYEGFAPGGAAIMLEAVTDNATRTVAEVRSIFTKAGGNLGERGSVAWNFDQRGVIVVEASGAQADELALMAIDAGAEDFDQDGDNLEIRTSPNAFESARQALEAAGATILRAELALVPKTTLTLDVRASLQTLRLLDRLEGLDDVQRVYTNADFPQDALEEYQKAS
ncbi:MAG: YebC/PmpR family DNA-binding transcriptional regulator [Chloroflexi bacterium]|nr:YebC/PmpR family DNA-binding transcriptional regulator [Chloroflexota bacterium]